jgi:hypothetical protein
MDVWRFQWGHSVFCNLQQWLAGDMVGQFNDRGQVMGVVPFPHPDHMTKDDPRYGQLNEVGNCFAVPRGISPEMTELAVNVYREYTTSFYKKRAKSDRVMDYLQSDSAAESAAMAMFLDVRNETYGADLLDIWKYLGNEQNVKVNEYANAVGIYQFWSSDILGNSLYAVNGAPPYATAVDQRMGQIDEIMNTISSTLDSDSVFDNIKPKFADAEGASFTFASGTDPASIDWASLVTVSDNLDALSMAGATIDFSGADFNAFGNVSDAVKFSIADAAGNVGEYSKAVTLYDAANTTPPTMEMHGEYRKIQLDENANDINWANDFVWYANDKDGIDIKASITADLSQLDTTTAGTYPVVITCRDYAGNELSMEIEVEVVKE